MWVKSHVRLHPVAGLILVRTHWRGPLPDQSNATTPVHSRRVKVSSSTSKLGDTGGTKPNEILHRQVLDLCNLPPNLFPSDEHYESYRGAVRKYLKQEKERAK